MNAGVYSGSTTHARLPSKVIADVGIMSSVTEYLADGLLKQRLKVSQLARGLGHLGAECLLPDAEFVDMSSFASYVFCHLVERHGWIISPFRWWCLVQPSRTFG